MRYALLMVALAAPVRAELVVASWVEVHKYVGTCMDNRVPLPPLTGTQGVMLQTQQTATGTVGIAVPFIIGPRATVPCEKVEDVQRSAIMDEAAAVGKSTRALTTDEYVRYHLAANGWTLASWECPSLSLWPCDPWTVTDRAGKVLARGKDERAAVAKALKRRG